MLRVSERGNELVKTRYDGVASRQGRSSRAGELGWSGAKAPAEHGATCGAFCPEWLCGRWKWELESRLRVSPVRFGLVGRGERAWPEVARVKS